MSPEQRSAINRHNASHSTGPVSESGKAAVSGNATKHGLAGRAHAVLAGEEEAFAKHLQGYVRTYNPQSTPESDLVRTLAENFWRLQRAHAMESAAFELAFADAQSESSGAHPAIAHAEAFLDPVKSLQRLATYAARIQRAIERTAAELKSLQSERQAAYAKAEEEAMLLTQLANAHAKVSEAAAYATQGAPTGEAAGFVYSFEAIKAKIVRQGRLAEARARFAPAPDLAGLVKGALI